MAIPNSLLSHNAQGQLVVGFYIQTQQGFIALATIQRSVMVHKMSVMYIKLFSCCLKAGEKHYRDAGFILVVYSSSSILSFASSSSVSEIITSSVPMVTITPPPVARGVSSLVAPLVGAVGGAIVLGILITIIVITAVVW